MHQTYNLIIEDRIEVTNSFPKIYLHPFKASYKNDKVVKRISEEDLPNKHIFLKRIKSNLLITVSKFLNEFHQTNYSEKFWDIEIGFWLNVYVFNMFEAWEMMSSLLDEQGNFLVKIRKYSDEDLIAQTMDELNNLTYNDEFKENIFFYIIKYRFSNNKRFSIEECRCNSTSLEVRKKSFRSNNKINFNKIILKIYYLLFSKIIKRQKYSILRSYLGAKDDLKLNFKLKQLPIFISNIFWICKPDHTLRKKIKLNEKKDNEFEKYLYKEIFSFMPVSFLEGFKKIEKKVNELTLPQEPKRIFSSNILSKSLLTRYCAHKVEIGAKLFLATHGGCYGHFNIHGSEEQERKISNLYLTYGWRDRNDQKVKPFGMIRPLIKFNKNKQKDLLTMILPNYSIFSNHMLSRAPSSYPCHTEAYFKIIDNLDNTIKSKNLLIRVLARDKGMSVQSVFENKYPNIKIDSQKTSLSEMLSNTRIFLSPYSGTGFLETLALNIPTIVSESTNRNNLFRKNANKYYEILKEAKIYFDDQELLAKHINSIWNNHQEWWDSDKVQKAKNIFCNEFAYINKNKVNELQEILINKHD